MLRHVILACLCLLVRADSEEDILPESFRALHHQVVDSNMSNYLISPDIFRGREDYLVAQYRRINVSTNNQIVPSLDIKFSLINDRRGQKVKHCALLLKGKVNSLDLALTSLRRVSPTNIVITFTKKGKNEVDPYSDIIFYDMKYCHVHSGVYDVKRIPIVVPSGENRFEVFIHDLNTCNDNQATCRWSYNIVNGLHHTEHNFTTTPQLNWETLRVEVLRNHRLKIHGSSIEKDRYLVFLLNPRNNMMNKTMELEYNNKKLDIASAGTALCWINPDHRRTVHCNQADANGDKIFEKDYAYGESRKLVDVRSTEKGEILVLSKNADCEGIDCWRMYATILNERSTDIKNIELPFMCSGDDQTKLTVFGARNVRDFDRTEFYYGCKFEDKFNLNSFLLYRH